MEFTGFNSPGVREIDFTLNDDLISRLKFMWKDYMSNVLEYPSNIFKGKGIVMCAGGTRYFTCAWICIKRLRELGCVLPIELWHLEHELSNEVVMQLQKLNVSCMKFLSKEVVNLNGVSLKPLAIIKSSFKDILFIDADNNCVKDPTYLFDHSAYLSSGAVFWPDYWHTSNKNPMWAIVNSEAYHIPEQESGQILINKEKSWKELNLCLYFNQMNKIYYHMIHGDKDTFRFAWLALNSDFHMIKKDVGTCGYMSEDEGFTGTTMVQHDFNGEILFLHRNLLKWDNTRLEEHSWKLIRRFRVDARKKQAIYNYKYQKHHFINLTGDIEDLPFVSLFGDYEDQCLNILRELKSQKFYIRFLNRFE